jgi:hypothetical protein
MQAFPEDDPVDVAHEAPLVGPQDTGFLLDALDGTGIEVRAETNTRFRVGDGGLRIVSDASAALGHPDAVCIDGLDARQWALLQQLHRPGERLPVVMAEAEDGAFRVVLCAWADANGMTEIRSLADLAALIAAWDGREPPAGAWNAANTLLESQARTAVAALRARAASMQSAAAEQQVSAARLRLIEELGRMLTCFEPDTDDLNGKFHRLASEQTPTATRLQRVFHRLGQYPDWDVHHIAALRDFRDDLASPQVKTRLTGRELDAALDDPRWAFQHAA